MALIMCPDCKREVSDKAEACPHCGCPLSDTPKRVHTTEDSFLTRSRGFGDIILYGPFIVIFFIILLVVAARGC